MREFSLRGKLWRAVTPIWEALTGGRARRFRMDKPANTLTRYRLESKLSQNQRAGRMARSRTLLGARAFSLGEREGPPLARGAFSLGEREGPPLARGAFSLGEREGPPLARGAFSLGEREGPPLARGAFSLGEREGPPLAREALPRSSRRRRRNQGPEGATSLLPARRALGWGDHPGWGRLLESLPEGRDGYDGRASG